MARIFLVLSLVVGTLLVVVTVQGFLAGEYNDAFARARDAAHPEHAPDVGPQDTSFQTTQRQARIHTLLGLLVALMGVFIQSLSITYFIGTGRWCKEVTHAYQLDPQRAESSSRLKRRSFPWAMLGIVTLLTIAAFGAAADPSTLMPDTQRWILPHAVASIGGSLLIGIALAQQYRYIRQNQLVIEQIVAEVRAIRIERGLAVE